MEPRSEDQVSATDVARQSILRRSSKALVVVDKLVKGTLEVRQDSSRRGVAEVLSSKPRAWNTSSSGSFTLKFLFPLTRVVIV